MMLSTISNKLKEIKMDIFELYSFSDEQVILKVNAKTPLDVAKHPYVQSNYEYITVTRGDNHILSIIYETGKTESFSWSRNGSTCVSENKKRLRSEVVDFISSCGIALELHGLIIKCCFYACDENNPAQFRNTWAVSLEDSHCNRQITHLPGSYSVSDVTRWIEKFIEKNSICVGGNYDWNKTDNARVGTIYSISFK
jgi:hypothetical protein